MAVALYPGAFKPPHRGHFDVVKKLLNNTHGGKLYDATNFKDVGRAALSGESDKVEKIDKVLIFVGGGERNGLTKEESTAVWNVYAKHLPGVEIMDGEKNPMFASKDYAKANPNQKFYAITGVRGEEDLADLRRITTYKNTPNVKGLAITGSGEQRATKFRQAILSGNLDTVRDFFPAELPKDEILKIINMLKKSIIAEIMAEKVDVLFDEWFKKEPVQEGNSGAPLAPRSVVKSEDRAKLVTLYNRIRNQVGSPGVTVTFEEDHIRVGLQHEGDRKGFDYTPFMASILEYMLDEGMNITPLPEVKVKQDVVEATDFFGRTAYYDPNENTIVLYTQSRHPKDVMRSFTHEMIHHIQNIEGRLGNIQTSNTNESEALLELEKEAYLKGNITFRNWEDKVKNMQEGLWANINAKRKSGKKASHGNSKAYKAAVKAGDKLEKSK